MELSDREAKWKKESRLEREERMREMLGPVRQLPGSQTQRMQQSRTTE